MGSSGRDAMEIEHGGRGGGARAERCGVAH